MTKHVKLPSYDAVDLNRISYSSGELVADITNNTVRLMNGITAGGTSLATQDWVNANALTVNALSSTLSNYVQIPTLSTYVTNSQLTTAIAGVSNTYSLPTATTSILGGVKVDGTTITISNGVISGANTYVLPKAQAATGGNTLGGVIPDGTTITINPVTGVITGAQLYTLPAATTTTLGGVKVPAVATSGLTNSSGTIGLATASATQLGGVQVDGSTITINSGIISAPYTYSLPQATSSVLGGVIIPSTASSGLINNSGAIRLATASTTQLGGVKVDGTTITISGGGAISAVFAGAITFVGAWSAAANSPALSNGSGSNGNEYICSAAGTVNFGAGNITFSVGDAVIYNGSLNQWIRIPASSALASLTFSNTGGASTGSTYNGTGAVTIDYSTLGASPLIGSSSLTTVGTIGTGTWNGSIIGSTYGGTGVNNGANTITLGGNLTTAGILTQSGAFSTTITSTASTSVTLPTSGTIISSVTALNGAVTGTPSSSNFLRGDGTWAAPAGGGTVTSITAGTSAVNGLSLSGGTITSSGTIAITGTLSGITNSNLSGSAGISNANLANSSITFGSTAQALGSTISAINGVAIGTSTAAQVNATNLVVTTGNIYNYAPNPTALTSTSTLTIAQLLTDIVTVTSSTAVTLTLPTGTLTDAGILSGGLAINESFDWVIINLGTSSGAVTMAAGTTHTYVGSATVAINTSAGFRTRKTAANTFVTYRIH